MEFIYQCPVCKQKLQQIMRSFVCDQRHTYDVSKEGYVNLLLANQKKTKSPGDNKLMAESRQKFLEKGYYDSLSDEINKIITSFITKNEAGDNYVVDILDLGCGIGFYSGKLKEYLHDKNFDERVRLWGIDISKAVIQKAAKGYSGIQFSIGSGFHLPYLDESLDIIFSVFSPFSAEEIFRVLKPGGKIIVIRPGPNHLKELATLIYGRFELQGNPLDLSTDLDLTLIKKDKLEYEIELKKNEDLMNLVSMTPYYWHLNTEKKNLLAETNELTASVDFQLSLFEKSMQAGKSRG